MKKRLLLIITISLFTCFAVPAGAQTEQSVAAGRHGIEAYKAGKYDEAIKGFDEAIKLDPKDANSYRNRAIVWTKKGDRAAGYFPRRHAEPPGPWLRAAGDGRLQGCHLGF